MKKDLSYWNSMSCLLYTSQYAEAAQAFDTALEATDEKMPNTKRDILYYKATALYKNKDYENTISVCDEILTLNQEGDACYLRGACYMAQGDYDKAKTDFDAAVALSPKDYDLVLDIYGCYQEQKRSADGAPYLENALNIEEMCIRDRSLPTNSVLTTTARSTRWK